MWIVRLALRRPYTFVVLSLMLFILAPVVISRTPTDIFPNIDIPVVSVVWQYAGLSAEDMSDRIVYITERALTTTVNNIEHIESQSMNGIAVVKIFFQPHANLYAGIAQVTAISQTQLKQLPQGTTPPLIISYNASTVPIVQLALSGRGLSEQQLNDLGQNFVRTQLVTIPGTSIPYSYGGKQRQVMVDLNTQNLQSKGLGPVGRGECHRRSKPHTSWRYLEDRIARVHCRNQWQPGERCRTEQPPDQEPERHYHLRPRRGACPRRLSPSNQYCSLRWPAWLVDDRSQIGRRLYARHHLEHSQDAAAVTGNAAA